jgi:hypothetical protein
LNAVGDRIDSVDTSWTRGAEHWHLGSEGGRKTKMLMLKAHSLNQCRVARLDTQDLEALSVRDSSDFNLAVITHPKSNDSDNLLGVGFKMAGHRHVIFLDAISDRCERVGAVTETNRSVSP